MHKHMSARNVKQIYKKQRKIIKKVTQIKENIEIKEIVKKKGYLPIWKGWQLISVTEPAVAARTCPKNNGDFTCDQK